MTGTYALMYIMEKESDTSENKFSVVMSGGGMKCCWSAGFLLGLAAEGLVPTSIIAKSGSAGTAAYLSSGQVGSVRKIWVDYLSGNRFINFWRFGKIIDIDYLVDDVCGKEEKIDFVKLRESNIKIIIPAYNATLRKTEYFSNHDLSPLVFKATNAVPMIYGSKVMMGEFQYFDVPTSAYGIMNDCKDFLNKKVILIDAWNTNLISSSISNFVNRDVIRDFTKDRKILLVKPTKLKVWLLSSKKENLEKSFDDGYSVAIAGKKEILDFLMG